MTNLLPELRSTLEAGRLSEASAHILSRASVRGQQAIAAFLQQNHELKIDAVLAVALLQKDAESGADAVSSLLFCEAKKERRETDED